MKLFRLPWHCCCCACIPLSLLSFWSPCSDSSFCPSLRRCSRRRALRAHAIDITGPPAVILSREPFMKDVRKTLDMSDTYQYCSTANWTFLQPLPPLFADFIYEWSLRTIAKGLRSMLSALAGQPCGNASRKGRKWPCPINLSSNAFGDTIRARCRVSYIPTEVNRVNSRRIC